MLEIRRGIAVRSYENIFFREFSRNLAGMFEKHSIDGLLIANSECDIKPSLQIDALLITNKTICIIEFKNYEGEIILPSISNFFESQWLTKNNLIIKGGSTVNPYMQLRKQKAKFAEVFNNFVKNQLPENSKADPSHTHKIVCFQKPIELKGSIPGRDELSFFITDSVRYLDTIKDIIDVKDDEINLTKQSFNVFNKTFIAEKFDINEKYINPPEIQSISTELESDNLYPDQKVALEKITEFISSDNEQIFIIQGTSSSGKSYLLPYIQEIAYNNFVPDVQLFALSRRVAANLKSEYDSIINSLYSYIYTGKRSVSGNKNVDSDIKNEADLDEGNIESSMVEVVPLKKSENDNKALFIVDEAQLVSANFHLTSKNLKHGSGKLLEDFLSFTDFENSNRKVIFIGDNFQLDFGKKENSSLNPKYFEDNYNLKTNSLALDDKFEISPIIEQVHSLVNGIRGKIYNNLSFQKSENFNFLNRDEVLPILKNRIGNNQEFRLLRFSNKQAYDANYWIKKDIINNGEDLAEEDLTIFNNNCIAGDTDIPSSYEPVRIYNGQFGKIVKADKKIIQEIITPKGKQPVTLKFREVIINLKDTGKNVNILSIENYRNSENGELSEEEEVAFQILLNRELGEEIKNNPFKGSEIEKQMLLSKEFVEISNEIKLLKERKNKGEKVVTKLKQREIDLRNISKISERKYKRQVEINLEKDLSSKFCKYKHCAHLRFGWALTVHRSMSYKWDEIFFIVDQGENRGRENEGYYKWIYTGLTRAKNRVNLIHYKPITPLSKIVFKNGFSDTKRDNNIFLITRPESTILETYQLLNSKLEAEGIKIKSKSNANYQIKYKLESGYGEIANVSLYYNKKGHIKFPKIERADPKGFGEKVINVITSETKLTNFDFISDKWRADFYIYLNSNINKKGYKVSYILQTSFKDEIKIVRKDTELVLDMHYGNDGFFSSAICSFCNNVLIWEEIKVIIDELKGE